MVKWLTVRLLGKSQYLLRRPPDALLEVRLRLDPPFDLEIKSFAVGHRMLCLA